jgi:hypothetical protein
MTIVTSGYPGSVDEIAFSRMMSGAFWNSIVGLSITPSGSDRGVEVAFDRAVAPGLVVEQTIPMVLNADPNATGGVRRDRVILKHDWSINTTTLEIKHGAAGGGLPAVTRDPGILWEQVLGVLNTQNGQGAYVQSDIDQYFWRQSPLLILPSGTPDPFVEDRAAFIQENTGRLLYSDGSTHKALRSRHVDLDRRILKRRGGGGSTIAPSGVGPYSSSNATHYSVLQEGESWAVSGGHSAQFRLPVLGLWRVSCAARFSRTNSGQTGRVHLRLKRGVAASSALGGVTVALSTVHFPISSTAPTSIPLHDIIELGPTSGICIWVLENASSHTIDLDNDGTGCFFSLEYLGPK